MATLLDTGLIEFLLPLFVFLFIFVVIYALLSKTNLFGEKQTALNFLASICIAAVSIFAGNLVKLLGAVTPWIVFMIVILVLIFGMYSFFGVKNEEIWTTIGGQTVVYVIILIILLIGLNVVFESEVSPFSGGSSDASGNASLAAGKNVRTEVVSTLTHPKLLGALFILLVSAFTIKLLVDQVEKK